MIFAMSNGSWKYWFDKHFKLNVKYIRKRSLLVSVFYFGDVLWLLTACLYTPMKYKTDIDNSGITNVI